MFIIDIQLIIIYNCPAYANASVGCRPLEWQEKYKSIIIVLLITEMDHLKEPPDNKKTILKGQITISLMILGVVLLSLYAIYSRRSLLKNKSIENAIIYEINKPAKGTFSALYGFKHNNEIYKGSYSIPEMRSNSDKYKLIGRYFPVVYDSSSPNNNFLLLTKDDFKEFEVHYIDSLNWVQKLLH